MTTRFWLLLASLATPLFSQTYSISTVAGRTWPVNAPARSQPFYGPWSAVQDTDGTIYVSDQPGAIIWKIAPGGNASVFAGIGLPIFGGDGGAANRAGLANPGILRLDGKGSLFVVDGVRIRRILLSTGVITTVAGNGGTQFTADGSTGPNTSIAPFDVAIDNNGNLFIADGLNGRIRRVAASNGIVSTVAGNGNVGFSGDGGIATSAAFFFPIAVAVDSTGILYVADGFNNRIRKVDASGIITTVAGNGSTNNAGDDGPATNASVPFPNSLALEPSGNLLIVTVNNLKRLIVSNGRIERVAGGTATQVGDAGDGGAAQSSLFNSPTSVDAAANGDILVADFRNFRVRRIRGTNIDTAAGIGIESGVPATSTYLNSPFGVTSDHEGGFWISDRGHRRVRRVDSAGKISTTAGTYIGTPEAIGREGTNYYIPDPGANTVLLSQSGQTPTTFAGTGTAGFTGDGGRATSARLSNPVSVMVDENRNVYIADLGNCRVRVVDTQGNITTLAGAAPTTSGCGFAGDGGPASLARVSPDDLAVGGGKLYIAELANHRVRQIDLATKVITTVAGSGPSGYTGDGGPATSARLNRPSGVAVDAAGNLYICDYNNSVVRVVRGTTISTIAGNNSSFISSAESGAARSVTFDPYRLNVAADGSILILDRANQRIRRLTASSATGISISSGNNLSGAPGEIVRLSVKVTDAAGSGLAGIPVAFAIASGQGTLSSATASTDSTGTAFVNLTLGSTPGQVQVTATVTGLTAATFNITITNSAPSTGPVISDGGVVGAGLSAPAVRALSTGGIASIFGQRFGAGATFAKVGTADLVGGRVPTSFKGVCVEVGGAKAPVFGASDTQVNFQAPVLGASANTLVRVLTGCGTASEQASNTVTVAAQAASPEFFYFAFSADGKNPVAATDAVTGALIAPATLFPGAAAPTGIGKIVTAYATGFGGTSPAVAPGEFFANIAATTGAVRVFLGGTELAASDILYAGITPGSPGLYQLNIRIPAGTPSGNLALVIQVGSNRSPDGPFLAVAGGAADVVLSKPLVPHVERSPMKLLLNR